MKILNKVCSLLKEKGYIVNNIDSTVCLESPKIADYVPEIKKILAENTCLKEDEISIKATTTEKLGFTGRKEGVAAFCVILVTAVPSKPVETGAAPWPARVRLPSFAAGSHPDHKDSPAP